MCFRLFHFKDYDPKGYLLVFILSVSQLETRCDAEDEFGLPLQNLLYCQPLICMM